jgi:NTP pyrophosphatase (non-canonical NTP hydrolase)
MAGPKRRAPYTPEVLQLPEETPADLSVDLDAYVAVTGRTDKMPAGFDYPALGLFGETGSLLTELKKKQRDQAAYIQYDEGVLEELGDVLWYFSSIVRRAGLRLSVIAQRMFREVPDWDEVEAGFGCFGDIQAMREPATTEEFESSLVTLAGKVGDLLTDLGAHHFKANRDRLSAHLVEILKAIVAAADAAGVSLDDAVHLNLRKTFSRWPLAELYPPLADGDLSKDEQLPRRLEMIFREVEVNGKLYVIQTCNGIKIGDRLTDNKTEKDDYRFHDVFHIAYAVYLGWSPVLRALFRVKRKSDPELDENQDGARAILIEEGVATFVFGRGLARKLFRGIERVDFDTLKAVAELIRGYEVERCALWQWEKAILQGFRIFRSLKKARSGIVTADLEAHTLDFRPLC